MTGLRLDSKFYLKDALGLGGFFFFFFEHDIVCAGLLGCVSQVIKRKAEGRK